MPPRSVNMTASALLAFHLILSRSIHRKNIERCLFNTKKVWTPPLPRGSVLIDAPLSFNTDACYTLII